MDKNHKLKISFEMVPSTSLSFGYYFSQGRDMLTCNVGHENHKFYYVFQLFLQSILR